MNTNNINQHKPIILFDLDGTLIDSTDAIVNTFYHSFEVLNFKHNFTERDITSLIGYPLDIMYSRLGVEADNIDEFVQTYKKRYREISIAQTLLLDFAKESVKLASSFARLGIVTTKTGAYSKPLLEHFGIWDYFETLVGREDVTNPKPHEEPILKALSNMDITDRDDHTIYMIGDTKLDLESAKNAGVKSFGVLCGYGDEDELRAYTKNIAKNTLEAIKMIEKSCT
jgi:phosphoglycolate phosphatase